MRVYRVYYFSGSIRYTQFSIPGAHQDIYPLLNGLLKKGAMNQQYNHYTNEGCVCETTTQKQLRCGRL